MAGLASGCASVGTGPGEGRAALLVPLSGRHGATGQAMAAAARLAVPEDDPALALSIYDTGDGSVDLDRAIGAARGADIVLGPLLGADIAAVSAGVGPAMPLVSFSNDAEAAQRGSSTLGVTPEQSIGAVLRYARRQGVRRVSVLARSGVFGQRVARGAEKAAAAAGITLVAAHFADPGDGIAALRTLATQNGPDAVLLPDGGAALTAFARAVSGTGLQVLGTTQWSGQRVGTIAGLNGAWFAAPDPSRFSRFADEFQAKTGGRAGVLAGLAYDAARMCRTLAQEGQIGAAGLTRPGGFDGVTGRFRLGPDGRCSRDMAILTVGASGARIVDQVAFA